MSVFHPGPASPANRDEPVSTPDSQLLIDAARTQVRHESRQRSASVFAVPVIDAPEKPATPLARAMAPRQAGERMLAGGILQITAADGRIYCLQAPPGFGDNGMTPALAVPSNCP